MSHFDPSQGFAVLLFVATLCSVMFAALVILSWLTNRIGGLALFLVGLAVVVFLMGAYNP